MLVEALKEDSKRFLGGEIVWEQSETMGDEYAELVRMSVDVESGEVFVTRSWMSRGGKPTTSADINGVRVEDLPEWDACEASDRLGGFRESADGHLRVLWTHDGEECSFYVARRARVGEEESLVAGIGARHPHLGAGGAVQFEKPLSELSVASSPRFR
ncbi:hypothetical protein [Roseibium sp. RKSG952]|uniref:hypothetical protein n=1 Tax=Roseibium sp. RKSG952 TaxID=2529384 RepID=UPI0012BD2407|nr:hypothetical protein [Roseibium sp. RKSG952]MTH95775.1 hypothetical protein [Roseibium sp. RKSG952]